MDDKNLHFAKLSSGWQVQPTRVNIIFEQSEAEVVPSSSLVEVEVEIEVGVEVKVGVEVEFGVAIYMQLRCIIVEDEVEGKLMSK